MSTETEALAALKAAAAELSADELADGDLRAAAEKVAKGFNLATCRLGTALMLMDHARAIWRQRNYERERDAERAAATLRRQDEAARQVEAATERDATKGFGHGSTSRRNLCACDRCAEAREWSLNLDLEYARRKREHMQRLLNDFAADLRMEWTQELLDAGFAMPDGTVRTWRDATADEHRERIEMLTTNAIRNAEAAARHQVAIRAIESAGTQTLGEAIQESA